jgi:hypothetical protein
MSVFKLLLCINLIGYYVCNNNIEWITCLISSGTYLIYTYLYYLSFNNTYFAMAITPKNYSEEFHSSHKLVAYGVSTLHAIFISFSATLYLLDIIDNYDIKQAYFISISYYFADIYYVSDSVKKLKKLEYFTICHHIVMILMCYLLIVEIHNDINLENTLLYYFNRGLLAEYSVIPLNYTWYLVNTKQDGSNNMFISSILTLVLYFITRIVNFTLVIYNLWNYNLLLAVTLFLPLFLINYYWFYKLMCKAVRIYNKTKVIEKTG